MFRTKKRLFGIKHFLHLVRAESITKSCCSLWQRQAWNVTASVVVSSRSIVLPFDFLKCWIDNSGRRNRYKQQHSSSALDVLAYYSTFVLRNVHLNL